MNSNGYSAIHGLYTKAPSWLDFEKLDRSLSLLYAYHAMLTPRAKREKGEKSQNTSDSEEEALRWFSKRLERWRREGRINRFGLLSARPYVHPIPLGRLRKAFPQAEREALLWVKAVRVEILRYG